LYEVSLSPDDLPPATAPLPDSDASTGSAHAAATPTTASPMSVDGETALVTNVVCENKFTLWHNRFGHFSTPIMSNLRTDSLYYGKGVYFSKRDVKNHQQEVGICTGCALGKMHHTRVRRHAIVKKQSYRMDNQSTTQSKQYKPGELFVADLMHSSAVAHQSGSEYALVLMDVSTKYVWTYFMRSKDQTLDKIQEWLLELQALGVARPAFTTLRTDNGGEFTSAEFITTLLSAGLKREVCPPYAHVYMVERVILTLRQMARSYLYQESISLGFWAEAVAHSTYVLNRMPPHAKATKTRYELFHGRKPRIDNLRVFGCPCYVTDQDPDNKWEPRAWRGVFVGLMEDSPLAWKIWNPTTRKYIATKDVIFDERVHSKEGIGLSEFDIAAELKALDELFTDEVSDTVDRDDNPQPSHSSGGANPSGGARKRERDEASPADSAARRTRSAVQDSPVRSTYMPRRSKRIARVNLSTDRIIRDRCLSVHERITPNTLKESQMSDDAEEWHKSRLLEIQSIIDTDSLEVVEKPKHAKVLPFKWVFKIKEAEDGTIARFKTRLTAGGHRQEYGVNYEETFAPVVRYSTLRTLIAIAAARGLKLHQMDVDTAFLYGELPEDEEPVYMRLPDDFPVPPHLAGKKNLCVRIKKALYGLKQSPRLWNAKLDETLKRFGFRQSRHDPCLYVQGKGKKAVYISVFVDDLVIAGPPDDRAVNAFKDQIKRSFRMKDLGELKYVLGMEVERHPDGRITLTQKKYIRDVLHRFGMSNCKPSYTPLEPGIQLELKQKMEEEIVELEVHDSAIVEQDTDNSKDSYRAIVGSLMYLMISTRPDIAFAVGYLARYLNCYDQSHIKASMHVLRYVKATSTLGITYHPTSDLILTGYSDSDWASDINTRRSTTGYLFTLAGGAISWNSRLQKTVALSSTEAEYMALSEAAKEAIALRSLCRDMHMPFKHPVLIYEDNQGAKAMAYNPIHYAKTKHIHIRHHFIREKVADGDICVEYISTSDMLADALTKALPRPTFTLLRDQILGTT